MVAHLPSLKGDPVPVAPSYTPVPDRILYVYALILPPRLAPVIGEHEVRRNSAAWERIRAVPRFPSRQVPPSS